MNHLLFFDTETTGLPKNYKGKMSDVDNWPRVIQLAYLVCDREGNTITEREMLIKPDGWEVPTEKFWIDNGFCTKTCTEKGIPMQNALLLMLKDMGVCSHMVAHNMAFDYPILGAEMIRYKKSSGRKPLPRLCTMQSSIEYCNLPRMKYPKLVELHEKLFGVGFDDAHDALSDVLATKKCFFAMLELGLIKL